MPQKSESSTFLTQLDRFHRSICVHSLLSALLATVVISGVFLLFPSIDIAISATFYVPGRGFLAATEGVFRWLRTIGLLSINASVIIVICLTLARCLIPLRHLPDMLAKIRPRHLVFLASTLAIGPGVIANVILKDHWGRARPLDSVLFGGSHAFTAPWVISDACVRNCSFVSGEGSGVFWFVALAFVAPAGLRLSVAVCALTWAGLISLNRIAFGGHFLSDVLIGWGLMLIVMLLLREIVLVRYGARIDAAIDRWVGERRA